MDFLDIVESLAFSFLLPALAFPDFFEPALAFPDPPALAFPLLSLALAPFPLPLPGGVGQLGEATGGLGEATGGITGEAVSEGGKAAGGRTLTGGVGVGAKVPRLPTGGDVSTSGVTDGAGVTEL